MPKLRSILLSSKAAIDLASIMVGVIVIGLIGGVIAATVFAVIPWAQDNAAKDQLQAIHTAQNAAYGFSSDSSRELPAGQKPNSFTDSFGLDSTGYGLLVQSTDSYCTLVTPTTDEEKAAGLEGKNYEAYAKSGSGKIWFATNSNKTAVVRTTPITPGCEWLGEVKEDEDGSTPTVPETPDEPVRVFYKDTRYLLNCAVTQTSLTNPFIGSAGTLQVVNKTSGDATNTYTLTSSTASVPQRLESGVEYELIFEGTFTGFRSATAAQKNCYQAMTAWGTDSGTASGASAFLNMTNLTRVPESIPETVKNLTSMFQGATSFNQPLNNWEVDKVEHMNSMFNGATSFSNNLSGWTLNNVTAQLMFSKVDGTNLNLNNWTINNTNLQFIFGGMKSTNFTANDWVLGSGTTTGRLFNLDTNNHTAIPATASLRNWDYQAGSSASITFLRVTNAAPDVTGWKFAHNVSVSSLFSSSGFNEPINSWDVSKLTSLVSMFNGATKFNQPLNNWNIENVITMSSMFQDATSFNQPLNNWKVDNVKVMSSLFQGATSFNQPLNNWNTSNVTHTTSMFNGATSFSNNLSGWTLNNVNPQFMFGKVDGTNLNLNNWTVNNTDLEFIFGGMKSANFTANDWVLGSGTTTGRLFNLDKSNHTAIPVTASLKNWDYQAGSSASITFIRVTNAAPDVTGWKFANNVSISSVFSGSGFNEPVNSWDVSKLTTMNSTFNGATKFNQPLNNWKVDNITVMSSMFQDATSFNQPLNNWNTSNVKNLTSMFQDATSFNQPLNNWNTNNVTHTTQMFNGATSFSNNLSGWTLNNVTAQFMFSKVDGTSLNLNNWTVNNTNLQYVFGGMKSTNFTANDWVLGSGTTTGRLFNLDTSNSMANPVTASMRNWDYQAGSSASITFLRVTNAAPDVTGWKFASNVSVSSIFSGSGFNEPINSWDVSKLTSLVSMFNGAAKFNQPLNNWNTGNATVMSSMFNGATTFNQDISGWNVDKVSSFSNFSTNSGLSEANKPTKMRN